MTTIGVAVLGPVRFTRDGEEVDLGPLRQREVIAALALAAGEPVPSAVVIQRVWGGAAPATALATLHGYVAALRRVLEPDRPPRAPSTVLVTQGDTYLLRVDPDERDEVRFERAVAAARARLAVVPDHLVPTAEPQDRETVETALDELDDALAQWRGTPYVELGDDPVAGAHRARLEDLRRVALELRVVGQLALGRHDIVRAELEARTAEYALHERWWALRAVALARESRQADALAVLDELRAQLVEELGVDMSPPLQDLRTAILRQDASVVAGPAPTASPLPVRARSEARRSPWRMVGRTAELAQLRDALDRARRGHASCALLSGPAGIGKSRLVEELAVAAVEEGWTLAVGQCTQDAGSPPMWPWVSVLETLGTPLDLDAAGEAGSAFRVRAELVARMREAALRQPLLVVLEDLHWADASTLAVLRLLVQTMARDRMMVVATWRSASASAADLGGVAEAFARSHGARLELSGLDELVERELFETVAGRDLPVGDAAVLHHRTGGSPFYVVELARLASGGGGDLHDHVLDPTQLPASILEVLGRRLAELPDGTVGVLRSAAVLGHSFDLETLGDVTRSDPEGLLDAIEPALLAGLLDEEQPEAFCFSHALVADALLASMSTTRLARTHQLVAEILERRPGREAEVARHWRAAGPRHVGQAWRAIREAARVASSWYAHVDAAELLQDALDLQAEDAAATLDDRWELLRQAQDACRWAAMRPELIALVEQAVLLASEAGDVVRAAEAATVPSGVIWRSAPDGEINEIVVGALRWAVRALPPTEAALRCRALTALTIELHEVIGLDERVRLCDDAVAGARQLDDPELLGDVLVQAVMATWAPSTAAFRLRSAEEAVTLAEQAGRREASAMARTLLANVYGEMGRPADLREAARAARALARELKIVYAELALDVFELAWTAAAGRFAECEAILSTARGHLTLLDSAGAEGGLPFGPFDLYALRLWQDGAADALPALAAEAVTKPRLRPLVALALVRNGRVDEAREHLDPGELAAYIEIEDELSCPLWCAAAEVALYLGEAELAARIHRLLEPCAGRASGADGYFFGPVDAFLALAARAAGDRAAAAGHADRALELVDAWGLPPARRWLEQLRAAYDF